jgi:hypothetical protein
MADRKLRLLTPEEQKLNGIRLQIENAHNQVYNADKDNLLCGACGKGLVSLGEQTDVPKSILVCSCGEQNDPA